MTLRIEVAGRTRTVEVSPVADRQGNGAQAFLVTIDGRRREVSVSDVGGVLSLLVGNRSFDVSLAPAAGGTTVVHVDGTAVALTVVPQTWAARTKRGGAGVREHAGPQRILAPMPGKIVKVLVKAGDRVEPRQGVVVVEAMKMENELRALAAGTVTEVRAAEGASVEAGAILIVIE